MLILPVLMVPGAAALIGGRDSLACGSPVKTFESYWPHASSVSDYVKRAMPFNVPGSYLIQGLTCLTTIKPQEGKFFGIVYLRRCTGIDFFGIKYLRHRAASCTGQLDTMKTGIAI